MARACLDLYVWPVGEHHIIAVDVESPALYFQNESMAEGEWLEQLLTALPAATNLDGCMYGYDDMTFKPLDLNQMISDLKSGQLLRSHLPLFCMFPQDLVEHREVQDAVNAAQNLGYGCKVIGSGYYIVSNLVRNDGQ